MLEVRSDALRIVALSDTHGLHRKVLTGIYSFDLHRGAVPIGDVLVHAGDITRKGEIETVRDFAEWMAKQPFRHKVVIAGNHDVCLDIARPGFDGLARRLLEDRGIHYLQDSSVTLDGVKFYGAPWTPQLAGWAFYDRNHDHYENAPRDIDVLITHAPPRGIRDSEDGLGLHVGSEHVVRYINRCPRLKLHIFGHVHEGYGVRVAGRITFVNACTCTRAYEPMNRPVAIVMDESEVRRVSLGESILDLVQSEP